MVEVVALIDQRIKTLEAELGDLRSARSLLTHSLPCTAVEESQRQSFTNGVMPKVVTTQLVHPPRVVDSSRTDPVNTDQAPRTAATTKGPKPGNVSGADRGKLSAPLTVEQCREKVREGLTTHGPKTPTQLAPLCGISLWQVMKAMRDWDEVEHTTTNFKSPYRLKPKPDVGPTV